MITKLSSSSSNLCTVKLHRRVLKMKLSKHLCTFTVRAFSLIVLSTNPTRPNIISNKYLLTLHIKVFYKSVPGNYKPLMIFKYPIKASEACIWLPV